MSRTSHPDQVSPETLAALGLYVSLFSYLEERLETLRAALIHGAPSDDQDGPDTLSYRERIDVVRDLTAVRLPDLFDEMDRCMRVLERERSLRNGLIHGRWVEAGAKGRRHWRREPLRRHESEGWDERALDAALSHLRAHIDHLDRLIGKVAGQTGFRDGAGRLDRWT